LSPEVPGPESTHNIVEWLRAARAGSGSALGRLLEEHRIVLLHIAQRALDVQLQSKEDAADLVQETFLDAQRNFAGFVGDKPTELQAWLCQILMNNVANLVRRYRHTQKRAIGRELPLEDGANNSLQGRLTANALSPSDSAIHKEQLEALQRGLERLPADYRAVLLLRHKENRSFEEIGVHLQRSADAARKLWVRAIAFLQQELSHFHDT
jgi:RNA polymerase sigma-70 factor (ECF subfamily)